MRSDQRCAHCGRRNDRADAVTEPGATPSPGDFTLCVYCRGWNRYGEGLVLLRASDEDMDAAQMTPLDRAMAKTAVDQFWERREPPP